MAKKASWLGNKKSRELHRIVTGEIHPPQCHLDSIAKDHRRPFKTAREALANKFDVAAFCTRKFLSRRNATHHHNAVAEGLAQETVEE